MSESRLIAVTFWALFAAGIALRIVLLFTSVWQLDSDNAVVYLISKHISEGDLAWFFWGQQYGGTLLEFAAGTGMLVFGPHVEVLGVTSILVVAGCTLVVRHVATLAFDRRTGYVAATLFWFSGFWMLHVSISDPGFYGPSVLLGLGSVAIALRPAMRHPIVQWLLAGLLAGLALWQSPMGFLLALPGLVVLIVRQPVWQRLLAGVGAFVVGALPYILLTVLPADHPAPNRFGGWGTSIVNLGGMFTAVLASTFGAENAIVSALVGLLCLGLLVVLAVLAARRRTAVAGVLVVGAVLEVLLIAPLAGIVLSATDFRYSFFLLPALAISAGWLLTRIRLLGFAAMLLSVVLTISQIYVVFPVPQFNTQNRYIIGDISALGDYLQSHHVQAALGDYWLAYAVTAETNEQVTVGALAINRRYVPYEEAAVVQNPVVLIVYAGATNDEALRKNTQKFPPSTRVEVSGFAIYTFAQPFSPFAYSWDLY
ncbi:hypothetical protein [Subtercola endophyticus]|uniref:hypothetical protein n=1 Tax=Subtercola endophyticus TaxID=2895559 RepID=UPI001E48FB36|nr:hypothetical protein [Subtercola endophyticus]UFS57751.1 hypothetical protein LQ955_11900 [Subtercola endophyticus]